MTKIIPKPIPNRCDCGHVLSGHPERGTGLPRFCKHCKCESFHAQHPDSDVFGPGPGGVE